MSQCSNSAVPMLGPDKEEHQQQVQQEQLQQQLRHQHQYPNQPTPHSTTISASRINQNISCGDKPEDQYQMSEDKNQQNASKLAIEAAAEAVDFNRNPPASSSLSSSSSSSSSPSSSSNPSGNNQVQNVQKQTINNTNNVNTPISQLNDVASVNLSSSSSASFSSAAAAPLAATNQSSNVNSSDGAEAANDKQLNSVDNNDDNKEQIEVKKFSEKSLQELADLYLNFKPSDIPDSGFVVSGIAGRFPNADNLNELWDNLYHARDMVRGPDDKRWPLGKFVSSC